MARNGFERLLTNLTVMGLMLLLIAALQIFGEDISIWTGVAEQASHLENIRFLEESLTTGIRQSALFFLIWFFP